MKTIALRFADNYAPKEGTIRLHKDVIEKFGFVWYGKFGNTLSQKIIDELLKLENRKILLIKSGFSERYWAYIEDISKELPQDIETIPEYYRDNIDKIKCWFKITKIEIAESDIMSKFNIASSGIPLSSASKHSMNPYFIIKSAGDEDE